MDKVERHGKAIINGQEVAFRSECGDYPVKNENGDEAGSVFVYTYFRENSEKDRPVLFAFNGGPGSSSLWLHMGVLGPKHACCDDVETLSGSGNYSVEDNPYSPLDVCDIVIPRPGRDRIRQGKQRGAGTMCLRFCQRCPCHRRCH